MSADRVYEAFLDKQQEDGAALVRASGRVELLPVGRRGGAPNRYLASFHCPTLVRRPDGSVTTADRFDVGIFFGPDYLRNVEPHQVVAWLNPEHVLHPNVRPPFICLGSIGAGTPLVALLYQIFEIATFRNFATHDGLNLEACQWARNHLDWFPLDDRPLVPRRLDLRCDMVKEASR